MKRLICSALSMFIFLQPYTVYAESIGVVESDVVSGSIEVLPGEIVSYFLEDNLGGQTYMEFNVQTRQWFAVDPDGSVHTGTISANVIDEYETENIPLPCFAGPWAAVGCIGAAGIATAVGFFACGRRAENNIRRIQNQCPPGSVAEIHSISSCGTVEAGSCVPVNEFQDPDPAPNPGSDFGGY